MEFFWTINHVMPLCWSRGWKINIWNRGTYNMGPLISSKQWHITSRVFARDLSLFLRSYVGSIPRFSMINLKSRQQVAGWRRGCEQTAMKIKEHRRAPSSFECSSPSQILSSQTSRDSDNACNVTSDAPQIYRSGTGQRQHAHQRRWKLTHPLPALSEE